MGFKNFLSAQRILRFMLFLFAGLALFLSGYRGVVPLAVAGLEHVEGKFGPLHDWPIIPIATMLMPDGRVLAYGTDLNGNSGAKLYYVIWDPSVGIGTDAFEILPNVTDTDIFCAGQALIPSTGHGLIIGGDTTVNLQRNYASSDVNIFDPATDTLSRVQGMAFKRWYATAVTLPNGEHAVLGGRDDKEFAGSASFPPTVATYSSTPEVRDANGNWRILSSASSDTAYGELGGQSWFYPRAWINPQGSIFISAHNGRMYKLDPSGTGTLSMYNQGIAPSSARHTSVMFAPGRILSLRKEAMALVIDINGTGEPIVSPGGSLTKDRQYGSATVLANGQVWVNGGSSTGNDLVGMALDSELWDPATGKWKTTASATTERLYHSSSLLLLDGTVFTGGGGNPGPRKQLNGEIFYPPYLFKKDGSGQLAPRPKIKYAPTTIGWDQEFQVTATHEIGRITLVRVGAATHTFNNETRFFDLPINTNNGNIVYVQSPASANIAPPGFYMLFAWNSWGFPSVAKIVQIG